MSTKKITRRYLLEGAVYAFDQSGILLHDAVTQYNSGSHSTAVVLAAYAREEMGRSRILRQLRKRIVDKGETVTLTDIKRPCKDHVKKQEFAQLSTVHRPASSQDTIAKLMRIQFKFHPQSQEYKEAEKRLNEITKRKRKSIPKQRHKARERALYVEPRESTFGWNRPKEITKQEAKIFLTDAANDYSVHLQHFDPEIGKYKDSEFAAALKGWNGHPELPLPRWPHLP